MCYEMDYEALSDGEIEALHAEHTRGERKAIERSQMDQAQQDTAANDTGMEVVENPSDPDPFEYLLEPECYTWYRGFSGYSRLPLRASWTDYRDDELAWTVYEFVTTRLGHEGLTAEPMRSDMWADLSDDGAGAYEKERREAPSWEEDDADDEEGDEQQDDKGVEDE